MKEMENNNINLISDDNNITIESFYNGNNAIDYRIYLNNNFYNYINDLNHNKVNFNDFNSKKNELEDKINECDFKFNFLYDSIEQELLELRNENKELRKLISHLNTRVNNLIAKEQVKKFYEKRTK